ncbi:MAG: Serine/threonine protein kinase related protein [Anaerolineae bacterium]|nr:MAG: Serine/threonine protein kinase related protein [Anaerolineae bacterium]
MESSLTRKPFFALCLMALLLITLAVSGYPGFGVPQTAALMYASAAAAKPSARAETTSPQAATSALADADWPQLGRDPQRSNYSPQQVNPPYCYIWKWYEVPFASRAQPVVAAGRLFIGGMDGVLYARNASTGAHLWTFPGDGSPIRHSAGVAGDLVVFSTHQGNTFALSATTGALRWQRLTGRSATAPLIDTSRNRVIVASTDGRLSALDLNNGNLVWQYDSGAPILTTPSMSHDGRLIFAGNEAIYAFAVNAETGVEVWRTRLYGQSLSERYPVVLPDSVIYRSQPVYSLWQLLHEGDDVLDSGGTIRTDWDEDWQAVKGHILNYLSANPHKQTFFVLNSANGQSRGVAPVLLTFGNSDVPSMPVVRQGNSNQVYVMYRPRQGIQTTGGSIHVSTRYDAELGLLDTRQLDQIRGLRTAAYPSSRFNYEFRLTSDEPAVLTMGGNLLLVESWERLGGINLSDEIRGELVHLGNVSNVWPECGGGTGCGPDGPNPFFPLSGNPADPAYPFPSPRVGEGASLSGAVIANNMIYWRVIEGGLAGIAHRSGSSCPNPIVYTNTPNTPDQPSPAILPSSSNRPLAEYVTLDLTNPQPNPPPDLVQRLRDEVRTLIALKPYPMPYYFERGMNNPAMWPHNSTQPPDPPAVTYGSYGSAVWHDSGELVLSLAMAYPYLDDDLKREVRAYVSAVIARYPPWENMPYGGDWLKNSAAREIYPMPPEIRNNLNNWPPPAASPISLYAVWLWAKNSGDWALVRDNWNALTALYNARRNNLTYYADIGGLIGYARMARQIFGETDPRYTQAVQDAVGALTAGKNIQSYIDYAKSRDQYWIPRDQQPEWGTFQGWYVPVFFGIQPEIGLYLREQTEGKAAEHLLSRESGDGLRWWYLTRAGIHAEEGESAFVAPQAAWSHFMAHAYILGQPRSQLRRWLDRPWGKGDLYSIQKIVATLQAYDDEHLLPRFWLPLILLSRP